MSPSPDEHSIRFVVSQQKPRRYTTTDVARAIGRSTPTIVRWRRQGLFVPGEVQRFGTLSVYLYTDADVSALKKLAATQHPGRKPLSQLPATTTNRRNGAKSNKKSKFPKPIPPPKKRTPKQRARRG